MKTVLMAATMAFTALSARAQAPLHWALDCEPEVIKSCAGKAIGPDRRECLLAHCRPSPARQAALAAMRRQRDAAKPATPARP